MSAHKNSYADFVGDSCCPLCLWRARPVLARPAGSVHNARTEAGWSRIQSAGPGITIPEPKSTRRTAHGHSAPLNDPSVPCPAIFCLINSFIVHRIKKDKGLPGNNDSLKCSAFTGCSWPCTSLAALPHRGHGRPHSLPGLAPLNPLQGSVGPTVGSALAGGAGPCLGLGGRPAGLLKLSCHSQKEPWHPGHHSRTGWGSGPSPMGREGAQMGCPQPRWGRQIDASHCGVVGQWEGTPEVWRLVWRLVCQQDG